MGAGDIPFHLQEGFFCRAGMKRATYFRSVAVPVGESYRFGLGTHWEVMPDLKMGFAYEYALTPNMKVGSKLPVTGDKWTKNLI